MIRGDFTSCDPSIYLSEGFICLKHHYRSNTDRRIQNEDFIGSL